MSELQSFKWSRSLISSQLVSKLSASDISTWVKPLDLACASLVLLSPVKLAAVSILINQSSNCVESFPLKIVIYLEAGYFQKWFSFVQCIKFLYIVVELHLEVLMVLKGKALKIGYGVHILGGLWLLLVDFWWPQLCVTSDQTNLLIPSITCGFHALHFQNHLYPPDNHLEYLCPVSGH